MKVKKICNLRKGSERKPELMSIKIRFPERLLIALLLLLPHVPASSGQDVEPFKFFRDYVGLHEDRLRQFEMGKPLPG